MLSRYFPIIVPWFRPTFRPLYFQIFANLEVCFTIANRAILICIKSFLLFTLGRLNVKYKMWIKYKGHYAYNFTQSCTSSLTVTKVIDYWHKIQPIWLRKAKSRDIIIEITNVYFQNALKQIWPNLEILGILRKIVLTFE